MDYSEKLKDPRWQKKRLQILERDQWTCQSCKSTDKTLHVHHKYYLDNKEPWDVPDASLVALCYHCHEEEEAAKPVIKLFVNSLLYAGFTE